MFVQWVSLVSDRILEVPVNLQTLPGGREPWVLESLAYFDPAVVPVHS